MSRFRKPNVEKMERIRDIAGLTAMTGRENPLPLRLQAAAALATMGEEVFGILISLLSSDKAKIRALATKALGDGGDMNAGEPLIACLKDTNWNVRATACASLGRLGVIEAVDALMGRLNDENSHVRAQAALALGRLDIEKAGDSLLAVLGDPDWEVRSRAAQALGRLHINQATDALIALLEDKDSNVRANAAEALGQLASPRAVCALVTALTDKSYEVCQMAAHSLARLGWRPTCDDHGARYYLALHLLSQAVEMGPCAIDPLISVFISDSSHSMRATAALALGKSHDPRALGPLLAAFSNCRTTEVVRVAAAEALGQLGDKRAESVLKVATADRDIDIRAAAEAALEQLAKAK